MQGAGLVMFGGTFDPSHLGHLAVVRGLRAETGLPVLVVPAGRPRLRRSPLAPPQARLEMLELALATLGDPLVSICRRELEDQGPSVTFETVDWLRRGGERRRLWLALGADAASRLGRWEQAPALLEEVGILVFDRAGCRQGGEAALEALARAGLPLQGARALNLAAPAVAARSVRERLGRGQSCADLLPEPVADYIHSHELYRKPTRPPRRPGR